MNFDTAAGTIAANLEQMHSWQHVRLATATLLRTFEQAATGI